MATSRRRWPPGSAIAAGTLGVDDLAAYEPVARVPVEAAFRGRRVLSNPPPSSGGILIAYALDLLERLGETDIDHVVAAMEAAQAARDEDFLAGLLDEGFPERFLDPHESPPTPTPSPRRSDQAVARRLRPRTFSDRQPTSRPSTAMATARASPAPTAPAPG